MLDKGLHKSEVECNLFIVGTPYQLITTINIILNHYSSQEFKNFISIEISSERRFNPDVSEKYQNIYFKKVETKDWSNHIKVLRNWKLSRFFFFQEASIFNKFLSFHFKKKGTKICLGPDGTKAYGLFNKKHEFLSVIKDTFIDYKLLFQSGFFLPVIFWSKYYRYGSFDLIDEIWIPFIDIFNRKHNQSKGILINIPELTNKYLSQIGTILNIKLNSKFNGESCVIYFNQPFWSDALIEKDIEIVTKLSEIFKDRPIYVKLHPATNDRVLKIYSTIQGLKVIDDNIPAEFYMASCFNSIFIAGWSTCLMHKVSNRNRSYYLYQIFKLVKDPILEQIKLIDFPHVKSINNLNEIC